jgi:SAM-dependent methyltransferase
MSKLLAPPLHDTTAPLLAASTSKLCDITDWQDPKFQQIASELMHAEAGAAPLHRKVWEFTRVIWALQEQGVWHDQAIGLSVAGGQERFLFFAANHILRMVSTDIYGFGDFAKREADEAFLLNPTRFAPFPFRAENLRVARMNALALSFPDGVFDFAVSFSSIEHFGGLQQAVAALRQMARVTRPGGVIAFTTDCSLNGFTTNEVFTQRQMSELVRGSGCELVAPMNFSLSDQSKGYLIDMLRDDCNQLPHLNLKIYASIFTSACIVLRKPGKDPSPSVPVSDRLAAVEEIVLRAQKISPENLLPPCSLFDRVFARVRGRIRGIKYRLQERCLDFRKFRIES